MQNLVEKAENLEPVSMYTITAKLFTHLKKSIINQFGVSGQLALDEGIRNVIEEQISEIRKHTGNPNYSVNKEALFSSDHLADSQKVEQTFFLYKEIQEKEGLEAHTIYAVMARIFAHVSKAMVEQFGEQGREAVLNGVRTFGEERGRDIARRAAAAGKPNTKDHYLSNYDMGRSDLFEYETTFHPTEIEQTFTKCAFGEQWKKDGMHEYGILYCQMIDPAIAKGFNPNFEVIHDRYILKEGECHFRFQMKDDGDEKHGNQ